jgi:hypothetical protein
LINYLIVPINVKKIFRGGYLMPPIKINLDETRSSCIEIKRMGSTITNDSAGLSAVRSNIDSRILARKSIHSRLVQASRAYARIEAKLEGLERFIDHSVGVYSNAENHLNRLASSEKYSESLNLPRLSFIAQTSASIKNSEKWKHKDTEMKESFLGMTDVDWLAPFDGTNLIGTLLDAGVAFNVGYKVLKGYEIIRTSKGTIKMKDGQQIQRKKNPKGRKHVKYKIYDESYINSQAEKGNYIDAASYSKSYRVAAGAALKDKLGWISVGIDVVSDTKQNLAAGASNSKMAGDILGNVAVGAGALVVGGLTVAALPAAAGAMTIAAIGLGVSVGVTYVTEGIKWNIDLDKDGEDDSIKDVVKTGFGKAIDSVAGWIK